MTEKETSPLLHIQKFKCIINLDIYIYAKDIKTSSNDIMSEIWHQKQMAKEKGNKLNFIKIKIFCFKGYYQ